MPISTALGMMRHRQVYSGALLIQAVREKELPGFNVDPGKIAGHISSDTLGLNLLLDKIESRESLTVIECSGFKRIKRSA